MNINALSVSSLITILGVLIMVVNVITEVLKKVTWDKLPTNIVSTIVSIALTVIAFIVYANINKIDIVWYMIVGSIIAGFFVAYGAMFGFDKLKQVIEQYNVIKSEKSNSKKEDTPTTPTTDSTTTVK